MRASKGVGACAPAQSPPKRRPPGKGVLGWFGWRIQHLATLVASWRLARQVATCGRQPPLKPAALVLHVPLPHTNQGSGCHCQLISMATANTTLTGSSLADVGILYAAAFSGPILVRPVAPSDASMHRTEANPCCLLTSRPIPCTAQFWIPASTELLCAAVGRRGFSPTLAGLSCAAGQCTLFTLLFLFGQRISSRWRWLRRRVDSVALTQRKLVERGSFAMTVGGAAIGVPPTVPLFTLAPSLHMRLVPMLMIVFSVRFLRFASICYLGGMYLGADMHSVTHPLTTLRNIAWQRGFSARPQPPRYRPLHELAARQNGSHAVMQNSSHALNLRQSSRLNTERRR